MQDTIEPIPKTMEKFFGCLGKMVKPSVDTVRAIVKTVRKGSVITLEQLREKIATDLKVDSACPASTTKVLQVLAKEENPIAYWRVIKKKGELFPKFPNGVEGHAALLEQEGFTIDTSKKNPFIVNYENKLGQLK